MTFTRMPRALADGYQRLYSPDAPAAPVGEPALRELARRDESGEAVKVTRRLARWCPHGREYHVFEEAPNG